jgi:hypothetical protein
MYVLLKSVGYQIQDNHKLIEEVKSDIMNNTINVFL